MRAVLFINDPQHAEQEAFAARLLMKRISPGAQVECRPKSASGRSGLDLPGLLFISSSQLDEIFAAVSLQREVAGAHYDACDLLVEHTLPWAVDVPWVDLLARRVAAPKEPSNFQVIITHDIDRTTGWELTALVKSCLRAVGVCSAWPSWSKAHPASAWLGNLERLLACELQQGVGAYFFMLAGPYGLRRYSSRYDVRWPQSRDMVKMIAGAGMTVGLHGSYYARELDSYAEERQRLEAVLGAPVTCHRNHYLRFDQRRVWSQLQAAGITHDFSVGFNHRIGFRSGCASAHQAYDLVRDRPAQVVSIPLLCMDGVLFHNDRSGTLQCLRAALEDVRRVDGCVSLLFHPELFLVDPSHFAMFEEVVQLCHELGADLSGRLPSTAVASPQRPGPGKE